MCSTTLNFSVSAVSIYFLSFLLVCLQLRLFRHERSGDLDSASRAVQQVIERTKINIMWMDTNYDVIVDWLNRNGYTTHLSSS